MEDECRPLDPLAAFRLDGKAALVTGAGSGIGRAAAQALAAVGARVVLADIDYSAAEAASVVIAGRGGQARPARLDVADERAVEQVFAGLAQEGGVDVLINSAGISIRRPALELALADWRRVQDVNVTGSFLCARAAARGMTRGGAIVNIASMLGFSGGLYPNISYQTSKGAVVNMTRALALEWADLGVRVNALAPGYIQTPFLKRATATPEGRAGIEKATPLGRLGRVDEVVGAILLLASPASSFMTGHTIVVDGGFLAR